MSSDQLGDSGVYRKILVPLNGPLSMAALDYAAALAAKAGAQVYLLDVSHPADKDREPMYQAYLDALAERARDCLKEIRGTDVPEGNIQIIRLVKPLSGQTNVFHHVEVATDLADNEKVHDVRLMGPTAEQITSYAEDQGMDLIVMATYGRSEVRHWPVDSVAMSVARCCMVPVRLIRVATPDHQACNKWPDQKIVVLLDGSEASEQSLPYAIEHAKLCGAKINILRVWGPSPAFDYPGANEQLSLQEHIEKALEHGHEECHAYLSGLAKRLAEAGVEAKIHALLGDPAQEIVNYVTDNEFDLVVMTTHARCGEGVWPIGSITDKVLHRTGNPMLLVHPK
jgi:nucleotide-binding universal stress UspA family protein